MAPKAKFAVRTKLLIIVRQQIVYLYYAGRAITYK